MTMKLGQALVFLAIFGGWTGTTSAALTDDEATAIMDQYLNSQKVESLRARREGPSFDRAAAMARLQEQAKELTADLAVQELSLDNLETLRLLLQAVEEKKPQLAKRLMELARQEDADGARAALLLFEMEMNPTPRGVNPPAGTEPLKAALAHPGFAAAMTAGKVGKLFSLLNYVDRDALGDFESRLLLLASFVTDQQTPLELAERAAVVNMLVSMAGEGELKDLESYEPVRERLQKLYAQSAAIAAKQPDGERLADYLASIAHGLDSSYGRGQFLGHEAPELDFIWSSGDTNYKTLDELKGKIVVLDFWATWCGPCVASIPKLAEFKQRYKDSPVQIVGVTSIQGAHYGKTGKVDTTGEPEKEFELMKEFMQERGISWTIAFAEQEVMNPEFGIRGIPHVAILDTEGKVRFNKLHPANTAALMQSTDTLLKEAGLPVPSRL